MKPSRGCHVCGGMYVWQNDTHPRLTHFYTRILVIFHSSLYSLYINASIRRQTGNLCISRHIYWEPQPSRFRLPYTMNQESSTLIIEEAGIIGILHMQQEEYARRKRNKNPMDKLLTRYRRRKFKMAGCLCRDSYYDARTILAFGEP